MSKQKNSKTSEDNFLKKNIKVRTPTCIKVFANLSTTNPSFLQTYKE
jgi:hypothetical protein